MNRKISLLIPTSLLAGFMMTGCSQQQTHGGSGMNQQVMDSQVPAKVTPVKVAPAKPKQAHYPMVKPKQIMKPRPMIKPKQVIKIRPL